MQQRALGRTAPRGGAVPRGGAPHALARRGAAGGAPLLPPRPAASESSLARTAEVASTSAPEPAAAGAGPAAAGGARVARFAARRQQSVVVREGARPLPDYMALPASQYSVLDARKVERLDDDTFRCYVGRLAFLGFAVEPVITVSVAVEPGLGCTIRLLSAELQGSRLVQEVNEKFSATMTNVVRWAGGAAPGSKALSADAAIEVIVQVPRWAGVVPLPSIEAAGSRVMQTTLNLMVPRFLDQLDRDYQRWAAGDASRTPLEGGGLGSGGAMMTRARARRGTAPPPDGDAPSPLLRALAALDEGAWVEALLPKLRADAGSAPAFALACREARRLVQSSAAALSLRAADCAHAAALARLGQRFTGCSEVAFALTSPGDAGAPLATLLPALARLPRLTSLRLDAAASAAAGEPAAMAPAIAAVAAQLPDLRSLELALGSSWEHSDAAWRAVGLATQLTRVAVRFDLGVRSTVMLRHLSALTAISGLESLVVGTPSIVLAQHCYGFLAGLPAALTQLELPLVCDRQGLDAIGACTGLQNLKFAVHPSFDDSGTLVPAALGEADCAALARCTRLTFLKIPVEQGSDPHLLAALAALTGLQELTINQLSRASLPCLASLSRLTRLEGSWVESAGGRAGGAGAACTSVVELWGSGLVPFEAFPRLREMVQIGPWPPATLRGLAAHCSRLMMLKIVMRSFWEGPSFDVGAQAERVAALRAMAGLKRLRVLGLSASDDAEVAALATLTQVAGLTLRVPEGSACTPAVLMALARMTWLFYVWLEPFGLELAPEDVEVWLRALHFVRDVHVYVADEGVRAVWAGAAAAARAAGHALPAKLTCGVVQPRPPPAGVWSDGEEDSDEWTSGGEGEWEEEDALPGGAMMTRARARRCAAAPAAADAPSPLLRALAALDDGVWVEALLPKLRADTGSAPAFALACREARRLVQSSAAALSLRAADCTHAAALARLGQRFTGCSEVAFALTSPGDAGTPLATLLPALARLPRLTSLRLDAAASAAAGEPAVVAPAISAVAAQLPGLRSLDLTLSSSWAGSDAAWRAVGLATQLTRVAVRFEIIDDTALRSAAMLSHLSALTAVSALASLDVDIAGVDGVHSSAQHYGWLAGLAALTQLVLPLVPDHQGLAAIGACAGLRSLVLGMQYSSDDAGDSVWPMLGEAECTALARCRRLTSLNVRVDQGSDPHLLAALAALTGLQDLTVDQLSRESLPCLPSLSRLTRLEGSWVEGGAASGAIAACSSVVELWGSGLVLFEAFPCLREAVQAGPWPPTSLQRLAAHCSGLTALGLCCYDEWAGPSFEAGTSAQAERVAALRALAGLKELRVLDVSASDDAEVAALATPTQVTGLQLRVPTGSACTPAGLMGLARMTWLCDVWLELFGLELSGEDARAWLRALEFVQDVQVLVTAEGQRAVWEGAAAAARLTRRRPAGLSWKRHVEAVRCPPVCSSGTA
ncbi:hypothetical protein HT031_003855 [Scenedesmus sp. PABB004]|nr:hypothetical protein HT031_003855 [Scenedesmus sp. PABB004]